MSLVACIVTGSLIFSGFILLFKSLRKYFVFELDNNSKHYGGELVADVLKAHNVKFIFTLCGGHISPILTAAEKENISVIDVRHEASAVFAADAVSRLSGSIGVAAVTAGPGLTNTVTAVKNAQMAESPLILLTGASAGLLRGRGSLQDIDQITLFKPLCKWCTRINSVRDIVPVLCKAFYIARSDTPGPVLVEFPIDTLYPYQLIKQHIKIVENPSSLKQRILNWYLRFYLFKLFANGFVTKSGSEEARKIIVKEPRFPKPSSRQIEKLTKLIVEAQKPLILVGSQATLPPVPVSETAAHVKSFGIPVYLTGMSRGLLGRTHHLGFRHARRTALREADLIILAGVVCDFRLDYGRVLNRKAKIIIINRNKKQLYLNSDTFWRPHLAICADVGLTLSNVSSLLQEQYPLSSTNTRCPSEWIHLLQSREDKRDEEIRLSTLNEPSEHNNPLAILWKIEHYGLPNDPSEDSIIIGDGGDFVGSAAYILRPRGPLSWLDPGPFGTLGSGGGFALGAKLSRPNATVWVIYGDGSAGFSLAEWDSLSRHRAPAIGVIGNDACWSQIARDQYTFFHTRVACQLNFTPYEMVGSAYARSIQSDYESSKTGEKYVNPVQGGFLLTKANFDQFTAILNEAKLLSQIQKPSIINCLIAPSDFRDGSLSV